MFDQKDFSNFFGNANLVHFDSSMFGQLFWYVAIPFNGLLQYPFVYTEKGAFGNGKGNCQPFAGFTCHEMADISSYGKRIAIDKFNIIASTFDRLWVVTCPANSVQYEQALRQPLSFGLLVGETKTPPLQMKKYTTPAMPHQPSYATRLQ